MNRAKIPICLSLSGLLAFLAYLQPQLAQSPASRPEFEVVSIRQNVGGDFFKSDIRTQPGVLTATNMNIMALVMRAYGVREPQVLGMPDALKSVFYDINARAATSAAPSQLALMLRTLLEDRFHLKAHIETRNLPAYSLIVAKNGPKFSNHTGPVPAAQGDRPPQPIILSATQLRVLNGSMTQLVIYLAAALNQQVTDKTGLPGEFDFTVNWRFAPGPAGYEDLLPALEDQAGLRLVAEKAPVQMVIIDHVEKPTEN